MTGPRDQEARRAQCHGGSRQIIVADRHWRVYEREDAYDRRRGCMLVFESTDVLRLVRQYPPNWRDLSDEELLDLTRVK